MEMPAVESVPRVVVFESSASSSDRTISYRGTDAKSFDDIADPVEPDDEGRIDPLNRPGHGVELDESALQVFGA